MDPFALVSADLQGINTSIKALLGVDHPVLATVAKYFFDFDGGKKVRPALVLLMAHAVNHHMAARAPRAAAAAASSGSGARAEAAAAGASASSSISSSSGGGGGGDASRYTPAGKFTLSASELAVAQELVSTGVATLRAESARTSLPAQVVLPLQRRLAEITELIHTASLLHDDVIDSADTRRGRGSVNAVFGNKLAVLAGDFLLARASICLARLRSVPVVELLSTVIEHLVKGEVMQMRNAAKSEGARGVFEM
jgi:hexaprenyl-diphosphate synthase